jgi:hypothetical protein
VKQPLIKFGKDENELIVRFNTINDPTKEVKITGDMLQVLSVNAWYLLTFTFQDGYNVDGFEDGIMFKFYINDKEMTSVTFPNDALVTNTDPIHILPNVGSVLKDDYNTLAGVMADITYHNYALTPKEIRPIVDKGFNNSSYTTPGMKKASGNQIKYYSMSLDNTLQTM